MTDRRHISVRAGETDEKTITLSSTGLANLDALDTAVLYLREENASSNHVDGAPLSVKSSSDRTLTFDPVGAKAGGGNAFDVEGKYRGYVKATWDDGDDTRHPHNGWLMVTVHPGLE